MDCVSILQGALGGHGATVDEHEYRLGRKIKVQHIEQVLHAAGPGQGQMDLVLPACVIAFSQSAIQTYGDVRFAHCHKSVYFKPLPVMKLTTNSSGCSQP